MYDIFHIMLDSEKGFFEVMKNRNLRSLICYDFHEGILRRMKLFLIVLFCFLFASALLALNVNSYLASREITEKIRVMDFVLNIFAGCEPFGLRAGTRVDLPIQWLVFQSLLAYVIGFYLKEDLSISASGLILRMSSRRVWWRSKYIWCIMSVLIYYAVFMLSVIFMTAVFGDFFSFGNAMVEREFFSVNIQGKSMTAIFIAYIALPLLTSLAVSLCQMTASLIIEPLYCFLVNLCLMVGAVFYSSPALLYNFSMVKRNVCFGGMDDRISNATGCAVLCSFIIIPYFIGSVLIKRKDII